MKCSDGNDNDVIQDDDTNDNDEEDDNNDDEKGEKRMCTGEILQGDK